MFGRHPATETLSRLLDGMLDSAAQEKALAHLDRCLACKRLYRAQADIKTALRALPPLEENPLDQLQAPLFIPVPRPAFPLWGFAAGLAAGATLLMFFSFMRPAHLPMRVISVPEQELLAPGEEVNTLSPGNVDLEIPHQLRLRLRAGTTMTWQELKKPLPFLGRPNIVLNVMRGEVLARTQDRFWGSQLQIRTPSGSATVEGTAFSVKVEPEQDTTVVKVLAGSVFLSPYLGKVGLSVSAGHASRIRGRRLPEPAQQMSAAERKELLETYRIGESPAVALVIGGGPERTEELLKPALLYMSMHPHPELHLFMRKQVAAINKAILEGDLRAAAADLAALEKGLPLVKDPELAVPLRLFAGACDIRLGRLLRGRAHFRWVADRHPQHPLASLGLAALGQTAEADLKNPELAQAAYQAAASQYPSSPEAVLAKEFLRRY